MAVRALDPTQPVLARRGLAIYLLCLIAASAAVEWAMLRSGAPIGEQGALVALLMWIPALASVVARLVLREGFHDISLHLGGRDGLRQAAVGWLFPVVVGAAAYGLAWAFGLAAFSLPQTDYFPHVAAPVGKLALSMVLGLTVLTVAGLVTALGEEIGWRGYMLTRLVDATVPRPVLLSGLIWAAWHLPLVLSGQYSSGPYPLLSAVLFVVCVTPFSYLLARLRLESGSVWPAVVAHAAWNAVILSTFGAFTSGTGAGLWVGESGILTVLATLVVAGVLIRGTWQMRSAPKEAAFGETRALQV